MCVYYACVLHISYKLKVGKAGKVATTGKVEPTMSLLVDAATF